MDDGDDPSKEEIQVSPAKDQGCSDQEKLKRKNDEEEVDIGGSASSTGTSKKKKRGCCVDIPSSESDEEDWAPTPTREDNQPNRNMMVDDTEGRITLDIEDWRPEVLTVCPSSPDTDSP
ncbi:uncharacterized protein [Oryza sativa Japonica Group]|uniref:uncharacterized protein n=1 Tax=Oryza sativa subsp. japonica TaxID=39947 RepID=UPI0007753EF7|nr:uncharacterized protein LOC107278983 isoform X1 [Oryza sativa Japonica Group]KAF2913279.1 hypothetical protein DAI22_10g072501 [Oryza sativa Japonica Group]